MGARGKGEFKFELACIQRYSHEGNIMRAVIFSVAEMEHQPNIILAALMLENGHVLKAVITKAAFNAAQLTPITVVEAPDVKAGMIYLPNGSVAG